jgi:hypothetical protein
VVTKSVSGGRLSLSDPAARCGSNRRPDRGNRGHCNRAAIAARLVMIIEPAMLTAGWCYGCLVFSA